MGWTSALRAGVETCWPAHTVRLADGTHVPYARLVVATGVRASRLPGTEGVTGVHTLRTLTDALALKARCGRGGGW